MTAGQPTQLAAVIANHQMLGAEFTGIGGLPGELRSAEGYARAAAEMGEWAEKLAEAG